MKVVTLTAVPNILSGKTVERADEYISGIFISITSKVIADLASHCQVYLHDWESSR